MPNITQTERVNRLLAQTLTYCKAYRHQFIMPEHLLLALANDEDFCQAMDVWADSDVLRQRVKEFLDRQDVVPEDIEYNPETSEQMSKLIDFALMEVTMSSAKAIDVAHLVAAMLKLKESWAAYLLKECAGGDEGEFLSLLVSEAEEDDYLVPDAEEQQSGRKAWRNLVTCMNDMVERHTPLIGREEELQRTIQVLCRRDKNNPLHVGEPGVGKTAIVWGLARLIVEEKVPERLRGAHIYQLDMGTLLAGTQFRGDFEKRIKQVMDGIMDEGDNNIVYIDEIHTMVGAGATGGGAMDASNMLKTYLESGRIRFIGSTTYEELNRYVARSKGLTRRFQQIDIQEPSAEEAKNILRQLLPHYEEFHGVQYEQGAVDFAVEASARHINDRFLPDKAIDLIDEAGAAMEMEHDKHPIGRKEIADVLSKTCKVDALAVADKDDYAQLESLSARMLACIYGQDEAICQVVEAVQMSRAGLLDDNKPLASLLFVGPTGVGKTEVARTLARELGISLVRFDMSEYAEKHAVAKLIGSPAGYVGYEDGGLLTDAIRKSPNCVLLLDEIEKAHQDIYNILLQVMDYARLTDNKGRQADFRNVVLIMTSNAGAQFASQSGIGFAHNVSRGEAMMKQVKKTFKPEFINRLSGTVVFHDMNKHMATLILKKKLRELDGKLAAKKVTMTLTEEAFEHLLKEGFIPEYGAREMDRVISKRLKPLLMREILFGSLRNGGEIKIGLKDGSLSVG